MPAAEISAQIAKASAALSASPLIAAARQGLEQAQAASSRIMSSPEMQKLMAEVAQRQREEARIAEAQRLEEATLALDRARRSRLRRVFLTWDHRRQSDLALAEESTQLAREYRARGAGATGWPPLASELGLADYLQGAHRHPAVARQKPGGVREWFEDWRTVALAALREGLSSSDVAAIALTTPAPKEALTRLPVPGAAGPAIDWLRERFAAIARPNAPGGPRLDPSPVTGGELAAIGA
jgi:hypothetical protein